MDGPYEKFVSRFAIVFVLFSFLFVSFRVLPARGAFGISPPFLNADHLVKGARYSQTIYLVQDQPNEDLRIKAELEIQERVRSWVSIDKGFDFVIPKGVRQFPVQVGIQVPKDAGLGAYSGNLTFTSAPSEAGQVTIALGAQVAINLTVGTDIYRKISVPVVKLLDIEEGWDPRVYVKFHNDGNVPEAFTGATYELFDQFNSVRLAFAQKAEDFPETLPFQVKEYSVEFPIDFHLGVGQYWGSVQFFQGDKVVATQKTVFNVLKRGALRGPTAQVLTSLKENWIYYGLGGLVVVFASIFIVKRTRRRSS